MIALQRENQNDTTPKMEPENEKKEMTRENENNMHRKNDSENDEEEKAGGIKNDMNAKMESEDDKNEIIQRWKDLLNSQPKALIYSTRSPTPSTPFIWFCLSEQQSIRDELCREYPDITLREISQYVARAWASLCAEGKLYYQKMASEKAQHSFDVIKNKKRPSFEISQPQKVGVRASRYGDVDVRQGEKNRRVTEDVSKKLVTERPQNHHHFCSDGDNYDIGKQTLNTRVNIQKPCYERQVEPTIEVVYDAMNTPACASSSSKNVQYMPGFNVFMQNIYPLVLKEYNYLSSEDAMKVLERVWSMMPAVERERYVKIENEKLAIQGASINLPDKKR